MQPAMQPTEEIYLSLAWEAIAYVRGKVNAGSANRAEDSADRDSRHIQKLGQKDLDRQRSFVMFLSEEGSKPQVHGHQVNPPQFFDMDDKVCFAAKMTEQSGFGNCGEQAAVAYNYLKRLPLAGLVYLNLENGNHSFVVLGAGPQIIEGSEFNLVTAKTLLGNAAIVCDPWLTGHGFACRVSTGWEKCVGLMLDEAAPDADPFQVKVRCIARCSHKTQQTKLMEWIAKRHQEVSKHF